MIHKAAFSLASLASLALGLSAATPAQAQAYPSRAITMLVSFPPGGPTALGARALAQEMSGPLKQNIVVVNRAGAGGAIGATAIADATPDGYTVGFVSVAALTIRPHMHPERYNLDSFDYLCRAYDIPVFAMVRPDSRFKTMRDLIDFARANPGVLNYATVGAGSLPNMAVLNLSREAHIRMTHIPYKGEGPAAMALLGKQVDIYFGTNAAATRHHLHRLAVAGGARTAPTPATPPPNQQREKEEW
jgi:tripartite-type tricarboxylate transporter receptor subunit TctC